MEHAPTSCNNTKIEQHIPFLPSDAKALFSTDTYSSPIIKPSFFRRLFPSLSFFPALMHIVWKAAQLAKKNLYRGAEWSQSSAEILRALEQVGCRLEVEGLHNFTQLKTPCIFIGNHMSTLETFVLPTIIQPHRDVTFVVKQALLNTPVFKYVMRSRNPITVGRNNPREDLSAVLNGGEALLQSGRSLIIFPQSTRSTIFDPEKFNSIGIKLARKTGMPVVPIALKTDAWGMSSLLKDAGKIRPERIVHFKFGQPFCVQGNGKQEHENIIAFIKESLAQWS